jgi:hypothetical protein
MVDGVDKKLVILIVEFSDFGEVEVDFAGEEQVEGFLLVVLAGGRDADGDEVVVVFFLLGDGDLVDYEVYAEVLLVFGHPF